jgi:Berberine and berberine like
MPARPGPPGHHRLRRIKAQVDPTQLFYANHPITPMG